MAIYTLEQKTQQFANMSHMLASSSIIVDVFQQRDQALKFLDVSPLQFDKQANAE